MDPTLMEFYMGELEEAVQAFDAEEDARPAGTFGSNSTYLAEAVVVAARNVVRVWDQLTDKADQ